MAKAIPIRQALVFWGVTVLSAVLLYYGGQLSDFLISDSRASPWIRWLGVFVAVLAIVPWLVVIGLSLSVVDEYYRQVVLAGTAAAFVLDVLLHIGFDVAMRAQLLSPHAYVPELGAAMLVWMLCVGLASAYYRYRL